MDNHPADLAVMTRDELREVARELGVPLRLTKPLMIEAIVEARRPHGFDRDARDALHRRSELFYDPAGTLEGRDRTSLRARNRRERRHDVQLNTSGVSRNPMRPNLLVRHRKTRFAGTMVPYVKPVAE